MLCNNQVICIQILKGFLKKKKGGGSLLKPKHIAALLALVFAMMMPTAFAFADEKTFEVGDISELTQAVDEINAADSGEFIINLTSDIDCSGRTISFVANTTTIYGNGHALDFSGGRVGGLQATERSGRHGTVNLGSPDAEPGQNALEVIGYFCNGDPFVLVGDWNGGSAGSMSMQDGVVIRDSTRSNSLGAGVFVGGNGVFTMDGGEIRDCGISSGSVSFGGGVAVCNGGTFIMNDGAIQDCFATQSYVESTPSYNLFYNYASGGGVFVANSGYFEMNGGKITGCEINNASGIDQGFGVGAGVAIMSSLKESGYGNIKSKFVMNGGEISGNHSNCAGGGIGIAGTKPMAYGLAGITTQYQNANLQDPGLHINGGIIRDNTADGFEGYALGGGGIYSFMLLDAVNLNILDADIIGNDAGSGFGGGIEILTHSSPYALTMNLSDSRLVGNSAEYGGGIALYNGSSTGSCTAAFDADAPSTIYGNSASVGADDVFSEESSLIGLPDWDEMTPLPAEGEAVTRLHGWKWDVENGEGSLDYNGQSIPKKRYDSSDPYAYEPIDTETQLVYLKMVSDTVVFRTVTPIMDGKVMDKNIQKVISGQSCGDITFTPEKGKEIVSVKVNGKKVDFKLERDGSYIFKSTVIDEDTTIEVETQAIPDKPDDPEDPEKPSDPDKPDTPDDPDEPDTPTDPDKPSDPGKPGNGGNGGNGSGASASGNGGSSATSGATGSSKPGSTSSTGDGLPVAPIAVGAVLALAVAGGVAVYSRKAARRR